MNKILSNIKILIIFGLLSVLMIITTFKNNKIDKLNTELIECKNTVKVEYINKIDTIVMFKEKLKPYKVVEYETKIDSFIEEKILTKEDSAKIFSELLTVYADYNTEKSYEKILKNDSSMYVKVLAKVKENELQYLSGIIENRYPYKETVLKEIIRSKIVAGMDIFPNNAFINLGFENKKGITYKVGYDPINNQFGFGFEATLIRF